MKKNAEEREELDLFMSKMVEISEMLFCRRECRLLLETLETIHIYDILSRATIAHRYYRSYSTS